MFLFNIAAVIINVKPEQFATVVCAVLFAHQIVSALVISYVFVVYVKQLVTVILAVQIFNIASIIFVHRKYDAIPTMIVISMKTALLIRMEDLNVKIHATVVFCVVVMLNVTLVNIRLYVHAEKDLLEIPKLDVEKLNVNRT